MNKLFLAAIAVAGAISVAQAADMPPPAYKAPPPPPVSGLSGFYAGANFAAALTKDSFDFVALPGTGSLHPTGFMPGITVGAGFWMGPAWLGVEADADYDFLKSSNPCVVGITNCRIKSSFFLTQRVLVGMPLGAITGAAQAKGLPATSNWPVPLQLPQNVGAAALMPYATAGIAERRIEACVDLQGCAHEWLVGFAVGGGLRLPVSTHVSLDLSYLYVSYNKNFVPASGVVIFPGTFTANGEQVARIAILGHY